MGKGTRSGKKSKKGNSEKIMTLHKGPRYKGDRSTGILSKGKKSAKK